jgi:hypothetical protein
MNFIEPNDGSLPINYPFTYLDPNTSATHFSHAGVGGFVEFPTIEYRNSIPTTTVMHSGGLSSGRRKIGMIVYVSENRKFYQLIPRNSDGTIITDVEWNALPNGRKIALLNPDAVDIEDVDTGEFYSGSGNQDEVWTEIEVLDPNKGVISREGQVNNITTITESDYNDLTASQKDPKTLYIIVEE